jgi:hypothetical protein
VRRVLLVNALIFAVLAAAVALAYYGYSYTSEVSSNERELALLQELADDRVVTIESQIEATDIQLMSRVQIEPMSDLRELVKSTGWAGPASSSATSSSRGSCASCRSPSRSSTPAATSTGPGTAGRTCSRS